MKKIKLPKEGIFIGSGVYPTDTDTLMCTMIGHYCWQCQHFTPMEMIDHILADNQGNLAQVWGVTRGFSPRLLDEWLYALDEIGIDIPAPDWETCKNLVSSEYQTVFDEHKDRFGAGIVRFIREAKKRGIYTTLIYTDASREQIPKMSQEGGDFYLGYDFGEKFSHGLNDTEAVQAVRSGMTLTGLADRLISKVQAHTSQRHRDGWGNVMATSSDFSLDYEVLGGADIPVVEDFAFPSLNFSSGLSRGLYRQHDLPMWGSHLAHEHYSWLPNGDPRRSESLRVAMYLKYMAGSKMIINESGNWFVEHTLAPDSPKLKLPQTARDQYGVIGWGEIKDKLKTEPKSFLPYLQEARPYFPTLDYSSPISQKYRATISEFWNFVKENGTPEGQPQSTLALAKGNNDLTSARYNPNYAICGLYDIAAEKPGWFQCAPERGWKTARAVFFPEVSVFAPYVNQHISGTPYGQVDVVSFAKDQVTADFLLRNYKALMFAGWNTCSEKQYQILKDYVAGGGNLLISLPQLCTNDTRNFAFEAAELVRGGDFSELCGLKVKGRGECIYWAMIPPTSNRLGCEFPRRFGTLGIPIGDIEVTDPELETLVIDDEQAHPVVTLHTLGKGRCFFVNTWSYPGALDQDEGPGSVIGSAGLMGYLYRAIANENRGDVYITDDKLKPGKECDYIAFSYFPQAKKICLMNVDFECSHQVWLHQYGMAKAVRLNPSEFRMMENC